MSTLNLYVAFGKRRGNDTLHWILILSPAGSDTCTYYHVTGGPTQGRSYTLDIQANKRFYSNGIGEHHFICAIDKRDQNKLKASAQKVPAQRCQEWTTSVLGDLERKGLVPAGTHDYWFSRIECSQYSTDGVHGIRADSSSRRSGSGSVGSGTGSHTGGSGTGSHTGGSGTGSYTGDSGSYQTGGRSYAASSSTSSARRPDWVWDDQRREYRYWDASSRKWIFQSETRR